MFHHMLLITDVYRSHLSSQSGHHFKSTKNRINCKSV